MRNSSGVARPANAGDRPVEPAPAPAAVPRVPEHATIAELLLARADDDNTALLFEDQRWSWRELVAEAAVRSALLQELRPLDRPWHVGVLLENTPEYIFLIAGAALCGATVVGINPTRPGTELASDIRGTDCAFIATDAAYGHLLDGVEDHRKAFILNIGSTDYADRLARHRGAVPEATAEGLDPRTTLLLLFTSGSTGAPKAVICSTGRWAYVCQVTPIRFTADDVAYNAMPIFHGNALMSALGPCLANGAAFAMRRKFSASGSARHPALRRDVLQLRRPVAVLRARPARAPGRVGATGCGSASGPRRRAGTGPSSPGGTAARCSSPTARPRAPATSSPCRELPTARSVPRSRGSPWRSSTRAARSARRPGSTPPA